MNLEPPRPKVTVPARIRMLEKYGIDIFRCKCGEKGSMVTVYDSRQERRPKGAKSPMVGSKTLFGLYFPIEWVRGAMPKWIKNQYGYTEQEKPIS